MLDDLKMIHERDAADALGIAEKQAEQLLASFQHPGKTNFTDVHNIVLSGMGGSALAASFIHTWPTLGLPFEIVREYNLPSYVGPKTLVIVSSYSGNTEETLSGLEEAEARGAQIAVIAGGGKLWEEAEAKDYLRVLLPKAAQPRYAVLYNFKALLDILRVAGIFTNDVDQELQEASQFLAESVKAWLPTVPTANNPAKQLAQELVGKSVVIYAGPRLAPAAYKWKISINENAKQIAWWNYFPELSHNEFIGWSKQPVDKPYATIDLRGSCEHDRVLKRFEVTERLLSGMRPAPLVVNALGKDAFQQLLWTVAYGDFVSLYLALLNGLNPAPVDLVEKFKQELNK